MWHRVNSNSDWLPKYKHHPTASGQNTLTLRAPTRCSAWLAATNLMQSLFSMVEMSLQKFRLTSLFFGLTNVLSLSLDKKWFQNNFKFQVLAKEVCCKYSFSPGSFDPKNVGFGKGVSPKEFLGPEIKIQIFWNKFFPGMSIRDLP